MSDAVKVERVTAGEAQTLRFDLRERPTASRLREVRGFVESKAIKREPVRLAAAAIGSSTWTPIAGSSFRALMRGLRQSEAFASAAERVDALARALKLRSGFGLPVPCQVDQRPDKALVLSWGPAGSGITVRATGDDIGSLIGGAKGLVFRGEARELLDALWQEAKQQQAKPWKPKSSH